MDEPPKKRAKKSLVELNSFSKNSFLSEHSLGGPMARPLLPSHGKEDLIGPTRAISKEEFVRVISKSLYSLGYEKTGAVLEEESGIHLYSSLVTLFRKQLLDGSWDDSVVTLHKLGILDENILKPASFLIYENKFFELLEKNRISDALKTLRTEITSLAINKNRVHELSGCIVSSSQHNLLRGAEHGLKTPNSRLKLVEEMEKLLPPSVLIPEGRLEHLVEQALSVQREACTFHNSLDTLSLYSDHQCGKSQIPSRTIQILQAHHDEVWFLKFSDNGKYLASASNDKTAIVWEVHESGELSLKHTLNGHAKPVLVVAWSPDSQQLLTCGLEEVVRRWDVTSGECLFVYEKTGLGMTSCGWFSDGRHVLSTVTDQSICLWDLDGNEVECMKDQYITTTSEMVVTKDGTTITSMGSEILIHYGKPSSDSLIEEEQAITSLSLSCDDKFLLVNLANQQIHLWRLLDNPERVRRYKGHKRSRFIIRSCFGGSEQAFVASGSEDSQVYIWLRDTGDLVQTLLGHSGAVNCVSWNPVNPHMLASASDDHTIRIWGLNMTNPKPNNTLNNGVSHQSNGNGK